jgi:hypothetical protein
VFSGHGKRVIINIFSEWLVMLSIHNIHANAYVCFLSTYVSNNNISVNILSGSLPQLASRHWIYLGSNVTTLVLARAAIIMWSTKCVNIY